jgi:ketosteroid isomerase-like protein
MKIITSLIGIAGLSFATLAVAQEQQTASPAPEEKPSTRVEQATTPSSETTTTAKAPEQTTAQQKEKPAAPAASPKPLAKATSSPAATPLKSASVEATLKNNENTWEASYAAHNTSVAESLVANDFAGVYWDGRVMNKSAMIAEMKKDKDTYKSAVNEKLAVYIHGQSVAVVIGTTREKGTTKDGKPFDRMFRFTDTWAKRGSQWQCVASHVMKVRG